MEKLIDDWRSAGHDELEITRRLVDLFFVAVLLDAGAGDFWKFTEPNTGNLYGRSEGIAVAALYMFKAGTFSNSSVHAAKESVDGKSMSLYLRILRLTSSLQVTDFRHSILQHSGSIFR